MKKGFTLLELLIVIALLVLIAIVILVSLNPWGQINKSQDNKRKQELTQLSKVLEDYYNDKQCYPRPQEVCYPSSESGYNPDTDTKCYLCGNISDSPQITSYLSRLPCDPKHPNKKYLYQTDSNTCPTWYRIYTTLSTIADPIISTLGCSFGCGIAPNYNYNYGVTSPNTSLETSISSCLTSGNCQDYCVNLGKTCIMSAAFGTYSDINCQSILGTCSGPTCCSQNPISNDTKSFMCYCQ